MPTSADNNEVTDVTIDGQQVEEITADGDVVWTNVDVPDVVIDSVSNVDDTTADVDITVNDMGTYSTVYFYPVYKRTWQSSWSTDGGYTTISSTGSFSDEITGLSPDTNYDFRAEIYSDSGGTDLLTSTSEITKATDPTPPSYTFNGLTNITDTTVGLDITVTDMGSYSQLYLTSEFEEDNFMGSWTLDGTYANVDATGDYITTAGNDPSLNPDTTYNFRGVFSDDTSFSNRVAETGIKTATTEPSTVVYDSFEHQNLSGNYTQPDASGGYSIVSGSSGPGSAIDGSYVLEVNGTNTYVQTLYADPANLNTPSAGDAMRIYLYDESGGEMWRMMIGAQNGDIQTNGGYRIDIPFYTYPSIHTYDSGGGVTNSADGTGSSTPSPNEWHYADIYWHPTNHGTYSSNEIALELYDSTDTQIGECVTTDTTWTDGTFGFWHGRWTIQYYDYFHQIEG